MGHQLYGCLSVGAGVLDIRQGIFCIFNCVLAFLAGFDDNDMEMDLLGSAQRDQSPYCI